MIGLRINAKKTENMSFQQTGPIRTRDRTQLKRVDHFEHLGGHIESTERDVRIRIAKAWSALNRLKIIWKSALPEGIKKKFFTAVVESVLLHGAEAWTLTKKLESKLDETHTRMLRAVLNITWRMHPTINRLYGEFPIISKVIAERRRRFACHYFRRK